MASDFYGLLTASSETSLGEGETRPQSFIGEIARKFSLSPQTIRFYEDEGLLSPSRFGRFRIYTPLDMQRMEVIVACRRMGLSIPLIRELLARAGTPGEEARRQAIRQILEGHVAELERRRQTLEGEIAASRAALEELGGSR